MIEMANILGVGRDYGRKQHTFIRQSQEVISARRSRDSLIALRSPIRRWRWSPIASLIDRRTIASLIPRRFQLLPVRQ